MRKINIYSDCNTIPIYNFLAVSNFEDFRYLIIGYDGDKDSYVKHKNDPDLEAVYDDMTIEYYELIADRKALQIEKMRFDLLYDTAIYETTVSVLNIFSETKEVEVLTLLSDLGFKFNRFSPIQPQVDSILRKLKLQRNKLRILRGKLERAQGPANQKKESTKNLFSKLDKQAIQLELALGAGYNLNVREVPVTRWINLISIAKQINKEHSGKNKV